MTPFTLSGRARPTATATREGIRNEYGPAEAQRGAASRGGTADLVSSLPLVLLSLDTRNYYTLDKQALGKEENHEHG